MSEEHEALRREVMQRLLPVVQTAVSNMIHVQRALPFDVPVGCTHVADELLSHVLEERARAVRDERDRVTTTLQQLVELGETQVEGVPRSDLRVFTLQEMAKALSECEKKLAALLRERHQGDGGEALCPSDGCLAEYDPDPYAHDIAGDNTPVLMCGGCRHASAEDI